MSQLDCIQACTDLGVHVDGAHCGPKKICDVIDISAFHQVVCVSEDCVKKEKEKENKKKNFDSLNRWNASLYAVVKKCFINGKIPFTIGGDHSISIATALASKSTCENLGLVWLDAHADFHTLATTETGNLHGVPFATLCGQNRKYHEFVF